MKVCQTLHISLRSDFSRSSNLLSMVQRIETLEIGAIVSLKLSLSFQFPNQIFLCMYDSKKTFFFLLLKDFDSSGQRQQRIRILIEIKNILYRQIQKSKPKKKKNNGNCNSDLKKEKHVTNWMIIQKCLVRRRLHGKWCVFSLEVYECALAKNRATDYSEK